ncbi:MAG: phenylacetate--CoA ligase family protein [Gammaproteobacteria bacterium]|nr:phenylacetate--CoA ligase family protein [Gammaproteobacteria bacterium]
MTAGPPDEAATDRIAETAAQARWTLRPDYAGVAWFERLIDAEFADAERQRAAQEQSLGRIVAFAQAACPYYRQQLGARRFDPARPLPLDELPALPVLSKTDLLDNPDTVRPAALPRGEQLAGSTASSGTTGKPVTVWHTANSLRLNEMLLQRQLRWFRYNPAGRYGVIRLPTQLPPGPDGAPLADGDTYRAGAWPQVGRYFDTGPYIAFGITNPVQAQLDWLRGEQPDYLVSYSESLEHIALASDGTPPCKLAGVTAISEMLTADMEARISRALATRVCQSYGLNEAGLVAARCPAGNRYHVHTEHAVVEIVDDDGQPVAHGQRGRIVITVTSNPALPLIRYDTGDLAVALHDDCPCGRTLPSFGQIIGRYSRIAYLPAGSMENAAVLREALAALPADVITGLRRFQIHQASEQLFELRLQAVAPVSAAFRDAIAQAWHDAGLAAEQLEILEVDEIPRLPNGKFQDFTSVFFPEPVS